MTSPWEWKRVGTTEVLSAQKILTSTSSQHYERTYPEEELRRLSLSLANDCPKMLKTAGIPIKSFLLVPTYITISPN